MGLCGLALAWHRAAPVLGPTATAVAFAISLVMLAVAVALAAGSAARAWRFPAAWREDWLHPVRHVFIATIPISLLLIVTVAVALLGPAPWLAVLWWVGSLAQLAITVAVLGRWWHGGPSAEPAAGKPAGPSWSGLTPALFIPVVGNVVAPLAGVPLGFVEWSLAQFAIGAFFWPVVLTLVAVRLFIAGALPERLLPTAFIAVAPPAVSGLSLMQFGAPQAVVWTMWGVALFFLLWAATLAGRIVRLPFAIPHWAMSFPLAAFAGLTLRIADASGSATGGFSSLALAALALATLVIAALFVATIRGLRNASLLVAESTPAAAAPRPAPVGD